MYSIINYWLLLILAEQTCGATTSQNNTYFISPNYPATDVGIGTCTLDIQYAKNVCQIKLDFKDFSLAQPDVDGVCASQSFEVLNSLSTVPKICGENTGQHSKLKV